jgi:hypothetical protein
MKKALLLAVFLSFAFSGQLMAQKAPIFPKGKVATVDNHTGTVWLSELSKADEVFDFNAGARDVCSACETRLAYPSGRSNPDDYRGHWLLSGKRQARPNRS